MGAQTHVLRIYDSMLYALMLTLDRSNMEMETFLN